MKIFQQACVESRTRMIVGPSWRMFLPLLAATMAVSTAGCSGSSGGGSAHRDSRSVSVTVDDVFGAPVAGAVVTFYHASGAPKRVTTDASGHAQTTAVLSDLDWVKVEASVGVGGATIHLDPSQKALDLAITVSPATGPIGGIASVSVPDGGISDDGRSLEFNIRFIGDFVGQDYLYSVDVRACTPDVADDAPQFTANCIDGPAGMDAPYTGSLLATGWVTPNTDHPSLAVSLLLDQGSSVVVSDPKDSRLFAAKYLQTRLTASDQVVIAAFASDDASADQPALLPDKPVTIYPVENPQFTTDGPGYFGAIDSLASLEGGASPLYASIDRMIDFTAVNAPVGARRAVVVLSSGPDASCDSADACRSTQEALIGKSAAVGIPIVVVGLGVPSARSNTKALAVFAQGENGVVFWADDPKGLATILGAMPAVLGGQYPALNATIHLESSVAGAFAPGRIVSGFVDFVVCPWDCDPPFAIPFAVRIP
jgi:hypothetical protein